MAYYSIDQIASIMRQRMMADDPFIRQMTATQLRYNGDLVVLQPDVTGIPAANRPGPNFFVEGIDGVARIANANLPKITCPIENPDDPASSKIAEIRQGVLYSAWHESQLQIKLGRAYRHAAGYGTFCFVVVPDEKNQRVDIQLRDPLTAYPELRAADDIRTPKNVGFVFPRSAAWIRDHFPTAPKWIGQGNQQWETLWNVVEWLDEDYIVIGVIGPQSPNQVMNVAIPQPSMTVELSRYPNKAGIVPAVVPRRVTMNRIMGQMNGIIGLSDTYSRMLNLQMVATEKAIFPDMVVLSRTGTPPKLLGNEWKDGRTGKVNVVIDGVVETISKEPGPGTIPMLQMVDQHIRGTSGASQLYAGSNGGMRTGAGVDALGDFAANPMAAELNVIMQYALAEVNRAVVAVENGYFPKRKRTVYLGLPGSSKTVTYTPEKHLKRDDNVVHYTMPGSDPNRLAVAITQLTATDVIDRDTARDMHPLVGDSKAMGQKVAIQKVKDALLGGIVQEIATPGSPVTAVTVAHFLSKLETGETLAKAFIDAMAEAQTAAPAPGSPGAPQPPTGPDGSPLPSGMAAMLAANGGPQQGGAPDSVPPPNPALMNFRHVVQGMNINVSPNAT